VPLCIFWIGLAGKQLASREGWREERKHCIIRYWGNFFFWLASPGVCGPSTDTLHQFSNNKASVIRSLCCALFVVNQFLVCWLWVKLASLVLVSVNIRCRKGGDSKHCIASLGEFALPTLSNLFFFGLLLLCFLMWYCVGYSSIGFGELLIFWVSHSFVETIHALLQGDSSKASKSCVEGRE